MKPHRGGMYKLLSVFMLTCVLHITAQAASAGDVQEGEASYYADSLHGNKTASGDVYDKGALTAAHRKLPFGTKVKVTYMKTGKSVDVVINDRGPYAEDRIIDLSRAAANKIGLVEAGHAAGVVGDEQRPGAIRSGAIEGVEADDVIGTLCAEAGERGLDVLVSTGDKDLAQLVDERVTLVNTMNDSYLDREGVVAKFGVPPARPASTQPNRNFSQ